MKSLDFAAERGPLFSRLKTSPENGLLFLLVSIISGTVVRRPAVRRPPARPQDHSLPHGEPATHLGEIIHLHCPRIGRESGLGEIKKHRLGTPTPTHTAAQSTGRRLAALPPGWFHGPPWQPVRWRKPGSDCVSSQRQTGSRRRLALSFGPPRLLFGRRGLCWLKIIMPPILSSLVLLLVPAHLLCGISQLGGTEMGGSCGVAPPPS